MAATAPARLTPSAGRRFALSVGVALLVFAAFSWWRGGEVSARVLGVLGAALVVAGALVPGRLGPAQKAWMAVARGVSKLTTPIVLGIVYFFVLTPLGFLLRVSGRYPLRHRRREGSYWARVPSGGRSKLENQF